MPRIMPIGILDNPDDISKQCHTTNEPIFLTKDGHEDLVIMSARAFEPYEQAFISLAKRALAQEQEFTKTSEDFPMDITGKGKDAFSELHELRVGEKSDRHLWPYAKFPDGTQISYADIRSDGTLPVTIERTSETDSCSARCLMPSYTWSDVVGFSPKELDGFASFLRDNAPLIFELAEAPHDERLTD